MSEFAPLAASVWLTPYVLLVEVAMAACIAYLAAMVWSQRGKRPATRQAHDAQRLLRRRLRRSRMNLMLRRLKMDPGSYLRGARTDVIASQLHTCSFCTLDSRCHQTLAACRADAALSSCPNRFSILLLVHRAASNIH